MLKAIIVLLMIFSMNHALAVEKFVYSNQNGDYPYQVKKTGINYTFEFTDNLPTLPQRKQAGLHVLTAIYHDDSIEADFSKAYLKERARCYALDSRFYTYTLCFLPNDFTKDKQERFWGFVTQVPNGLWQLTHVLLPIALAFGLLFYFLRPKTR